MRGLPSYFYPRSPCGERHLIAVSRPHGGDFYPRSPCGERRYSLRPPPARGEISIHALLAESDHARVGVAAGAVISIHALLAESDVLRQGLGSWSSYFYPRSPCGERQQFGRLCFQRQPISIHALLAESDYLSNNSRHFLRPFLSTLSLRRATQTNTGSNESGEFLSTLSLRRATNSLVRCSCTIDISIHALLAESDNFLTARFTHREISIHALLAESDAWPVGISHHRRISIHALLAESDLSLRVSIFGSPSFLSTLSLRRATMILLPCAAQATHFYPRSPCGERPVGCLVSMPPWCISIHALLAESDTLPLLTSRLSAAFLSTLSLRRATQSEP